MDRSADSMPADPTASLDAIAERIRLVWTATRERQAAAWEGYLETGRLLSEARRRLPGDREFGAWLAAQAFPFSSESASRLRQLTDQSGKVRALLATAVASGGPEPGVNDRVRALLETDPEAPWDAVIAKLVGGAPRGEAR